MKNEAIIACCGEIALKFLEITLPQNIQFFDNYIIISDSKSKGVHEFCQKWPVTLLITDEFYHNGAKFNRGRTYNQAFKLLDYKDQVTLMDADCYITDSLGNILQGWHFNPNLMYGCRRVIIPKYKDFIELLKGNKELEKSLWTPDGIGFGYFQCFNYKADIFKQYPLTYPESYDNSEEDWKFRNFYFGDLANNDTEYTRNLKRIEENIYHLGEPNINGGKNFFIA